MRKKKETAERIANVVLETAKSRVYGLPTTLPSAIYIHSDGMRGFHADEVLAYLNPPLLARIGIKFWQASESNDHFHDSIFSSLEEQSDARPGVTFSHTLLFCRLSRIFGKDPIHIKERTNHRKR
ncbi:MAG: hypothetical protein AAB542_04280 [Patescibacteria group bacterium]